MELRPLGFGEIFDRAITVYVRNFIPFASLVSVVIVPLAVLQYVVDRSSTSEIDRALEILAHPTKAAPPVLPGFMTSPGAALAFVLLLIVVWAVWPFALNAVTVGVARLYRGSAVDFRACYRASLQRWPSVLALLLLEAAIFIAWYVGFVIAVAVVAVLATLIARASVPLGVFVGVFGAIVFVAGLLVLAPLIVALTFAMNAIVVEERSAVAALNAGFTRVFNRHEIWRALLFSIAAGAVMMAASSLTGLLAFFFIFHHWIAAEVIVTSVFRAAIAPFSIVLLAIYYFDVRIRREGYDLEAGLDRLTQAPAVA
ncbi:MAG TPA: hypothetical protein VMF61_13305 [Candidatus Acidoferrales bacterium]|nr:hypothetical protein [Candidatus Acidoferrales bacterium]